MTFSLVRDVAQILQTASIGVFAEDIFVNKEPDDVDGIDEVITIYHYGGADPSPNLRLDNPSIQIRVRGGLNGYAIAEQRVQSIKNLLLGSPQLTVNSNVYVGFWMKGDVIFLKFDDKMRPIFVTNWRVAVQPDVSDNRLPLG
jgi:hypothetical protein